MITHHIKRLLSAVVLLACVTVTAGADVGDDLQGYLDNLAASRPAKAAGEAPRQKAKRVRKVSIPIDIPVVDLSQFSSATDRTKPLEVKTDVKFTNGVISSSASFEGDCLLKVTDRSAVVIDASATVSAVKPSGADCLTAISISGSSSVTQYGDILAPADDCWAVYLDTEADTYKYMSGTVRGKVRRFEHQSDFEGYNGRIWHIGNYAPIGYDFADINAAMASDLVEDGDILLIDRVFMHGPQTVNKAVKIVGNQYYWKNDQALVSGDLNLECANVTVMGIIVTGTINVRDDYATIERCTVNGQIMGDEQYICDYAKISQCQITQGVDDSAGYDWTVTDLLSQLPPYVSSMPYFTEFSVATEVVADQALPVTYKLASWHDNFIMEYFWDEDPGWEKATPLHNGNNYVPTEASLPVSTTGLSAGSHKLVVRVRSNAGKYWVTQVVTVNVTEPLPPKPVFTEVTVPAEAYNDDLKITFTAKADGGLIDRVEYYWDNDPGQKQGHIIVDQGQDNGQGITRTDYAVSCADMTGEHTLYLRAFCGEESAVYEAKVTLAYDDRPYAFSGYENGRRWIIGNYAPIRYDFASINEAMASDLVKDGDVLQIDKWSYQGSQTISKKVRIVGNTNYQPYYGDLNIISGNVLIEGLMVKGNVNISENFVTLNRCWIDGQVKGNSDRIIRNITITGNSVSKGIDQSNSYNWTVNDNISEGKPQTVTDMPVFSAIDIPASAVAGEPLNVTYQLTNILNGIRRIEYFWDEDPGWSKATPLDNPASVSTADLAAGTHKLVIRAMSSHAGFWTTSVHNVSIEEPAPPMPIFTEVYVPTEAYNDNLKITFTAKADGGLIDRVEYYWDNDPGQKQGHIIVDQGHDNGQGISRTGYKVTCADMTSEHTLYLRAFCGSESVVYAAKVKLDYDDTPYAFNGYNGRKWIIGNYSPIRYDFADINAAMASDEVKDGDILQIDRVGYPQSGVAQTVSKKVKIVGNMGYTFDNYITSDINITSGNVSLEGLWVSGNINIRENSVNIDRCWVHGKISNNSEGIIRNVSITGCVSTIDQSNSYNWMLSDNSTSGRPTVVTDVPVFSTITVPSSAVADESFDVTYQLTNSLNGIAREEYFWDEDPGWGNATPLKFNQTTVSTAGLAPGSHTLVIRAKSSHSGYWATSVHNITISEPVVADPKPVFTVLTVPTEGYNDNFKITFTVVAEGSKIDWVEYFWDTDPDYKKGRCIVDQGHDSGSGISRTDYQLDCADMTGYHTLYIRALCGTEWTEHEFKNIILSYDDTPYAFNGYNGHKWIIGNISPIRYDFASINEAMASDLVKDGDVLQVDRASMQDMQTVSKKVRIVGNTGYDPYSCHSDLNITSGNVTVEGLMVKGNVNISENFVTLNRCWVAGKIRNSSDHTIRNVSLTGNTVSQGIDQTGSYNWAVSGTATTGRPEAVSGVPVFATISVPSSVVAGETLPVTYTLSVFGDGLIVECFWDEDPSWEKAQRLSGPAARHNIATTGLSTGSHKFVIRAKSGSRGFWTTSVHQVTITEAAKPVPVFKDVTVPTEAYNDALKITFTALADGGFIDWVEYYWDNAPGNKQGHIIADQGHDDGSGITRTDYAVSCADMTGEHTLYLRAFCGEESAVYEAKVTLSYDDRPYAFSGYENGRRWIIGNYAPIRYDFADINAAMASDLVKDGDILLVDRVGYQQTSRVQTVSKKVRIVGNTGYLFDNYISADLNITSGNVMIEGLWVSGNININENFVNINRSLVSGKIQGSSNRIIRNVSLTGNSVSQGIDQTGSYNWTLSSNTSSGRPAVINDIPVFSAINVPGSIDAGEQLNVSYQLSGINNISCLEYFWDNDPGWAKATPLQVNGHYEFGATTERPAAISTTGLSVGNHRLVIRIQSGSGLWATSVHDVTISEVIVVDPKPEFTLLTVPTSAQNDEFRISFSVSAEGGLIDWVEYYWDSDPGYQKGRCIVDQGHDGGNGVTRNDYDIDCTSLTGTHTFVIRARCGSEWTEHKFTNIVLTAHPINAGDLAALKLISDNLGLNGYWNFANEGRNESDFPGVTFVNHRVTEINLSNHALYGTLSTSWMPELPELTLLDLSRNNIGGDVTPLVAGMPKLQTLNLSYNRISQVSGALPASLRTLNLQSQMRVFGNYTSGANEGFVDAIKSASDPISATVGSRVSLSLPSLFYYNLNANDNSLRADIQVVDANSPTTVYGTYSYNGDGQGWKFTPRQTESIRLQPDTRVALVTEGQWQRWSAWPAWLTAILGDANIDGSVNILDVQHTLNYILATAQPFNLWASNTYVDNIINVQDIVCTINIILGLPNEARSLSRSTEGTHAGDTDAGFWIYEQHERIAAFASEDVSAIDVEIAGVTTDEVSLLLNNRDFQMIGQNTANGSRYIIYSPTGAVIPAGTQAALLSMNRSGQPIAVSCADAAAREVGAAIGQATGIGHISTAVDGTTVIETRLAPGIYIVRTTTADGQSKTVKILKK